MLIDYCINCGKWIMLCPPTAHAPRRWVHRSNDDPRCDTTIHASYARTAVPKPRPGLPKELLRHEVP